MVMSYTSAFPFRALRVLTPTPPVVKRCEVPSECIGTKARRICHGSESKRAKYPNRRKRGKMVDFAILASRQGSGGGFENGPKRGQKRPKIRVFRGGPGNPQKSAKRQKRQKRGFFSKRVTFDVHLLSRLGELLNTLESAHGGPFWGPQTPDLGPFGALSPYKW